MSDDRWAAVDAYIVERLIPSDEALDAALAANAAAGLPAIDVSVAQGKFLHLLVRISGARRILEVGTLGGYSTIWMARALPDGGRVVTLEVDPHHADVARANFSRAGVADRIDVRVGAALDTLPTLEGGEPFDFIFIDADKPNNPHYLEWALKLSRPGTIVIADNVVRSGKIVDAESRDETVLGTRALFDMLASDRKLTATALQTVGAKGWDGFAIGIVES